METERVVIPEVEVKGMVEIMVVKVTEVEIEIPKPEIEAGTEAVKGRGIFKNSKWNRQSVSLVLDGVK